MHHKEREKNTREVAGVELPSRKVYLCERGEKSPLNLEFVIG